MIKKAVNGTIDTSTEEKIKAAARVVFRKNGFAATRTRDIAEEADVNLALLNYYFRSKENLFEIIMLQSLFEMSHTLLDVFNDESTTLETKIELSVYKYIDQLIIDPDIPTFVLNGIRNRPDTFVEKLPFKELVVNSVFVKQFEEAVAVGKITESNPVHFILNLLGLAIFPFISNPILKNVGKIEDQQFSELMQERKRLIPIWIKKMFFVE